MENSTAPDVSFSSIDGSYDLIFQYRRDGPGNAGIWYYYAPGDPGSTLATISPDYGYWIHMTTNNTWSYTS